MTAPPICLFTEDTPLLFVRDETTRRLAAQAHDVAVEANALIEDCLKAIAENPHRHVKVTHEGAESAVHGRPSDRTVSLPTRWGDVQLRIRKNERFFGVMIGSFEAEIPVPWNRVTIGHVRSLLQLTRRAVRSAVLHEEAETAVDDIRAVMAAMIERTPSATEAVYMAPNPWRPGNIRLRDGSLPFDNGIKIPPKGPHVMEFHLVGGARTSQGTLGPQIRLSPLDVRLSSRHQDPMEWMRLVSRGIEIEGSRA